MKLYKGVSLFIVTAVYAAAFLGGLLAFRFAQAHAGLIISFLAADAGATIVVWAFGLVYSNASMYDPYWSVAPISLCVCFIISSGNFGFSALLYVVIISIWGIRLTLNWAIGWKGLKHEDWRYTMLRKQHPMLWPLTNFFGINMMPTLIVFAGMLPVYFGIYSGKEAGLFTFAGAAVCLAAVIFQTVSDAQMRSFRKDPANAGKHITSGLWRISRHPNYFGEVSLWWGLWIMQMGLYPAAWWTVFAPVAVTMLFAFISIPMMEKRLMETKEGYACYKETTPMLIPIPFRKHTEAEEPSV